MTDDEQAVLAAVRAAEGELFDLLRRLVRLNSENPPGRYEAAAVCALTVARLLATDENGGTA